MKKDLALELAQRVQRIKPSPTLAVSARAVLDGHPLPTPPSDAVANLRVIEAIFAAAAAH